MNAMRLRAAALAFAAAALLPALAQAQTDFYNIEAPRVSQRATVSQRLGITDVSIVYHRPLVKGRKIWGDVVPYGQVWRAGANEGTLFTISDDATVEGKPLPKGVYGLHMLPTDGTWTVIFSKDSTSWGSFSYDEKEDALRVTVKPAPAEMHEALAYDFDDLKPDSAVVTLRWDKLAVPFKVAVDVPKVTAESLRKQLKTVPGFTWEGYNEAALYCFESKTNYEEALKWVDTSIQNEERYDNLDTKSKLLRSTGKTAEADALKKKALSQANALQLHNYGRELLGEKKTSEAVAVFETNVKKNPEVWFVYLGLARGQSATGNYKEAAKNAKLALTKSPDANKKYLQGLIDKLEAGKDIN
jgi:tetratricopeptide (TPR) repeat protein